MKWIKASERVPEDPNELVCMRGDGGGCYHYETADKYVLISRMMEDEAGLHHKFDPEWLDESESPQNPTPTEQQDGDDETDLDKCAEIIKQLSAENEELEERAMKAEILLDACKSANTELQSILNSTQWTDEFIYDYASYYVGEVANYGDNNTTLKSPSKWLQERAKKQNHESNQ